MLDIEKRAAAIALSAAIALGCGGKTEPSPSPERSLDSYVYRISYLMPGKQVVSCYSDEVEYEPVNGGTRTIAKKVYCPDKELNARFFGSQISGVDLDVFSMSFRAEGVELTNIRETYVDRGLPVQPPFFQGE